jgi:hypothetical protein
MPSLVQEPVDWRAFREDEQETELFSCLLPPTSLPASCCCSSLELVTAWILMESCYGWVDDCCLEFSPLSRPSRSVKQRSSTTPAQPHALCTSSSNVLLLIIFVYLPAALLALGSFLRGSWSTILGTIAAACFQEHYPLCFNDWRTKEIKAMKMPDARSSSSSSITSPALLCFSDERVLSQ